MGIGRCGDPQADGAAGPEDHDFDLIELNEALRPGIACLRQLGVKDDADFVNRMRRDRARPSLGMSGAVWH